MNIEIIFTQDKSDRNIHIYISIFNKIYIYMYIDVYLWFNESQYRNWMRWNFFLNLVNCKMYSVLNQFNIYVFNLCIANCTYSTLIRTEINVPQSISKYIFTSNLSIQIFSSVEKYKFTICKCKNWEVYGKESVNLSYSS